MRLQNNRVVWSEGLFLRPQHFQQNERFVEHLIDSRVTSLHPYPWGYSSLQFDADALKLGRIALTSCAGVFPDGTSFSIPDQANPPSILHIGDGVSNENIVLAIPLRRPGAVQTTRPNETNPLARYVTRELDTYDATNDQSQVAEISVGEPHLRLLNEQEDHSNFATMPLCRIREAQPNEGILLDSSFIPPLLNFGVNHRLASFLTEILGFMLERGNALASTVGMAETGGVSQVSDFLFLQLINRHVPLIRHLSTLHGAHPELLYRALISLAGELATFSRSDRMAAAFPAYQHEDLTATFTPVINELRHAFSVPTTARVVSLPIELQDHGVRTVQIADRTLLENASFVLAVSAAVEPSQLQIEFPQHIKISPVEHIGQLVQGGYPGITARHLSSAPRAIPYHDGFTYFELERKMWAIRNLRSN